MSGFWRLASLLRYCDDSSSRACVRRSLSSPPLLVFDSGRLAPFRGLQQGDTASTLNAHHGSIAVALACACFSPCWFLKGRNTPFVGYCGNQGSVAAPGKLCCCHNVRDWTRWSRRTCSGSAHFLISSPLCVLYLPPFAKVRLWHTTRASCLHFFQHVSIVTSVDFHPQFEHFFLSGCFDKKIRVWNIRSGRVQEWQQTPHVVTAAKFSIDGKMIVAGNYVGQVRVFGARMVLTAQNCDDVEALRIYRVDATPAQDVSLPWQPTAETDPPPLPHYSFASGVRQYRKK